MMAAPPTITTPMPMTRSTRSYRMNRGVMRLSTTYDCWKNSCHGATVVPTMPMISSMTVASWPLPPGTDGRTKPCATWLAGGWASRYTGMSSSDPMQNAIAIRSNRRKLPVIAEAMMTSAASPTAMTLGTPRNPAASVMPMNSVTMVSALRMNRSMTLNAPQNRPNRSRISRACPTPVTAPSRSTISWFTYSTGISSTKVHSSLVP